MKTLLSPAARLRRHTAFGVLLLALFSGHCFAHGRFILPSHTLLSGEGKQNVSMIASISNDSFHPDRALGDNGKGVVDKEIKNLFAALRSQAVGPDGKTQPLSWQAFARFSVADLTLNQNGTWRVSIEQPPMYMTTFLLADGKPGRMFGKHAALPTGATNITRHVTSSRVDVFISYNDITNISKLQQGRGLELGGSSHPNDLFVGEPAQFQLLFDGKPLSQATDIVLVRANTRHRPQRQELNIKTDQSGKFSVTFDKAGFYLLETGQSVPGAKGSRIDSENHDLYVTLEIFP